MPTHNSRSAPPLLRNTPRSARQQPLQKEDHCEEKDHNYAAQEAGQSKAEQRKVLYSRDTRTAEQAFGHTEGDKKQEEALRLNKADVKKRLNDLLILNSEIDRHKQNIDGIQRDITHLDGNIGLLNAQLATLQQQLKERKAKYVKSMRYISRKHTMQDRLMFIFSAKSFTEMYRRLRFVREYASWQKAQGEMVKAKQEQVNEKQKQLQQVRGQKNVMLDKGRQEHRALESKQSEQQTMVNSLQKQQKTIQSVIAKQRKDASALNAQIDDSSL